MQQVSPRLQEVSHRGGLVQKEDRWVDQQLMAHRHPLQHTQARQLKRWAVGQLALEGGSIVYEEDRCKSGGDKCEYGRLEYGEEFLLTCFLQPHIHRQCSEPVQPALQQILHCPPCRSAAAPGNELLLQLCLGMVCSCTPLRRLALRSPPLTPLLKKPPIMVLRHFSSPRALMTLLMRSTF